MDLISAMLIGTVLLVLIFIVLLGVWLLQPPANTRPRKSVKSDMETIKSQIVDDELDEDIDREFEEEEKPVKRSRKK